MPSSKDYSNCIKINKSPQEVFEALTQNIPQWWAKNFDGDFNAEMGYLL